MPRAYLVRKLKLLLLFCVVFILFYGGNVLRRIIKDHKCSEEESKFLMDELVRFISNYLDNFESGVGYVSSSLNDF